MKEFETILSSWRRQLFAGLRRYPLAVADEAADEAIYMQRCQWLEQGPPEELPPSPPEAVWKEARRVARRLARSLTNEEIEPSLSKSGKEGVLSPRQEARIRSVMAVFGPERTDAMIAALAVDGRISSLPKSIGMPRSTFAYKRAGLRGTYA